MRHTTTVSELKDATLANEALCQGYTLSKRSMPAPTACNTSSADVKMSSKGTPQRSLTKGTRRTVLLDTEQKKSISQKLQVDRSKFYIRHGQSLSEGDAYLVNQFHSHGEVSPLAIWPKE